jgi:hypothetical protein
MPAMTEQLSANGRVQTAVSYSGSAIPGLFLGTAVRQGKEHRASPRPFELVFQSGTSLRIGGIALALSRAREEPMLYTLAVILLIAWLLGMVGTYTIGSFVHALLVIAIVLFLVGLFTGRRTIP